MVAYLKKPEGSEEFHQIVDFLNASHIRYALTENPTIYVSLIKQFWETATARTLDTGEVELTATIDGKVKIVTEASIRRHLQLVNSDGISSLLNTEIFEQLSLMGAQLFREFVVPQPRSLTQTHVADEAASTGVDVRYGGDATTIIGLEAGQGSVESLEAELKQTKLTYGAAYTKLIKKVKKLENKVKSNQARRRARIIGRQEHDMEFKFDLDVAKDVGTAKGDISTVKPVSIAGAAVTTASVDVSTATISTAKDKDKGIMEEFELVQTKTKLQQEQERLGYEAALRLQVELKEEERQRIASVQEAASSCNIEDWDDIQARVEADEELAQRLQAEEREKYFEAKKARLLAELINLRKRYFAAQKAEKRRNRPPTQAQQRTYMSNYIKHMGSHTLQQLSGYSFDDIKTLFETTTRRVNTFVPTKSEVDRAVPELAAESSKRDAEEELDQES
ncbi:hypothetical protein Tco_1371997, partial [Tanacetum coccineum]